MNYYRRWVGSYKKKTGDLSIAEHGVYGLLLDHYYATEKPLAPETSRLSRICGAITAEEQKAVAHVADKFFPICADGLRHNERADEELGIALATIEAQRQSGKETSDKRWSTDGEDDRSTDQHKRRSTKTRKGRSTKEKADRSTDSSTSRSPMQPTTDNLQPTADTRHPTAVNRQPGETTPPEISTAPPLEAVSPPVSGPGSNGNGNGEGHAAILRGAWWLSRRGCLDAGKQLGLPKGETEPFSEYAKRLRVAAEERAA